MKINPRTFSGEIDANGKAEDPGTWIDHYDLVSISNGWRSDKEKLQHLPIYLTGEAEDWFAVNRTWIQDKDRNWEELRVRFTERFRPSNYDEELEERLRTPMMKVGESVRAYADRYRRLRAQLGDDAMPLDGCRRYWIAGLRKEIKREVRIGNPTTFDRAVALATTVETADCADHIDEARLEMGSRPRPLVKNRSADVAGGEYLADEAAGLVTPRRLDEGEIHKPNEKEGTSADAQFPEFYNSMGPTVTQEGEVEDLVRRFTAWKFYSRMEKDQTKLRAMVLKAAPGKEKKPSVTCRYCKKEGHSVDDCDILKAKNNYSEPSKRGFGCFKCGKEGHYARNCEEKTSKPEEKPEKKPDRSE